MLMGNPSLYARPLPTVTRGVKGSRAMRTPCRTRSSSRRASTISGFCFSASSTTCRNVMECVSARSPSEAPQAIATRKIPALDMLHGGISRTGYTGT